MTFTFMETHDGATIDPDGLSSSGGARMAGRSGRLVRSLFVAAVCLLAFDCSTRARKPETFTPQPITSEPQALLQKMTVEEKAAQMVMVSLQGVYLPARSDMELAQNVGVGGVYHMQWASLSRAVSFISGLQGAARQSNLKIPLFVAGRYTCGMGQFLDDPAGVTPLPTQMAICATGDPENAHISASIAAQEMRSAGINMNLAPILEIAPVEDGSRFDTSRFSSDAGQVSRFGVENIRGFQENGVLSVAAGFPGTPDTPATPSRLLPMIIKPVQALGLTDLKPFRDAVVAGVDGIAVQDVVVPTIDPGGLPAMLSRESVTGLLREMWGFQGLIIADSISSRTITDGFAAHDAVVRAVNAGADILLSSGGHWRHLSTIGHIVEAVRKGEVSEETVNAAMLRILTYKQKYGLLDAKPQAPVDQTRARAESSNVTAARTILLHAITVLKNDGNVLPLGKGKYQSVFVTGVVGVERMAKALERYRRGVTYLESRAAVYDRWSVPESDITRSESMAKGADLVIVCTYSTNRIPRGQEGLVKHLVPLGKPVLVVALGSPFDIRYIPDVTACITMYGAAASPPFVTAEMESIVGFMFGDCPGELREPGGLTAKPGQNVQFDAEKLIRMPTGRLPVALGEPFPVGFGLTDGDAGFVSRVKWEFGDGSSADGFSVEHAYEKAGVYTVKALVVNAAGRTCPLTFPVQVSG